ncbi:MAG: hypothetical protein WCS01_09825 [bacterium]
MDRHAYTDFLLPRSSFLNGIGSVINIRGQAFSYNASESPTHADFRAIQSDWQVIGDDLREAMNGVVEETDQPVAKA